jgi:hypothetical protein
MIQEIQTVEDVKTFFEELLAEGLNFHPDDMFETYVHTDTSEPFYSDYWPKLLMFVKGKMLTSMNIVLTSSCATSTRCIHRKIEKNTITNLGLLI